jgi:uncharacterized repeat protein (TIGR02543 family)
LGATATSGLAVSYASNDESVCTVAQDGGVWKVTLLTAGYCSLTASQAGNDVYSEATPQSIFFQITVTLTYAGNTNDGGSVPAAYTGGGEVSLSSAGTMTKTGFNFSGWTIDGVSYTAGDKYNLTANKTATAIWKTTVTYNPQSGSVSPTSAQFTLGGTALTLPTPTRGGYVFNGWYTASTGGSLVNSSYTPTGTITLYAQWSEVFTVSFNANGGSGTAPSSLTQGSAGGSVTLPTRNDLTLTNSGFMGWSTLTANGTLLLTGASYIPASSLTLYAQWVTTGGSTPSTTSATVVGTASLPLTNPKFCYSDINPSSSFNASDCTSVNATGTYASYSASITGLTESTVYYYQLTGTVSPGSTNYYGSVRTFTTSSASKLDRTIVLDDYSNLANGSSIDLTSLLSNSGLGGGSITY